jgi:lipopolysaccharide transport system permease protein
MWGVVQAAWRYRQFIISSVRSEFAARYARSRLGAVWMILNPLAQAAIISFVLSTVLVARLPGVNSAYGYALYLMAGTLAWSLFQEVVNRSLGVFIDNAALLKKLMFPRVCLPLVVMGIALVANLMLWVATLAGFAVLGHWPGIHALWAPILLLLTLALAMGMGLVLGVVNVFVRDVGQVVPIVLQFVYWLTPIIYIPDLVPEPFRPWLELNPLFPLVVAYQDVLVFNRGPDWGSLLPIAILASAMLALAFSLFRRASPEIADAL